MKTDRKSFFQNEPIQNNSNSNSVGNRCGTEIRFPLQGHLLLDSTYGTCEGISSNLLSLLNLNIEQVLGEPLDQLLMLEAGLNSEEFVLSLQAELDEPSGQSFYSNIYCSEANYHCLITVLNSHNENSNQLLFLVHIPNAESSMFQIQNDDKNNGWVEVQKGIHKLNNVLTALYCYWDLTAKNIDSEMQEESVEIAELLDMASQELRNLTGIANNQIAKNTLK